MKKISGFVVLSLALLLSGCTRIGVGHVGVKVSMAGTDRGVENAPAVTGWVFYNPFSTNVIEYPTNVHTVVWTKNAGEGNPSDESVTFTNREGLAINADVSLNYSLDPNKVPQFYVHFLSKDLDTFNNGYLRTIVRNCLNDNAGNYNVQQIMGDNVQFLQAAQNCVSNLVGKYGVQMDAHALGFIGAPRPPEVVIQNINAKIQAEQIAQQKQNELLQVQADAAKQVAAAKGKADSMVTEANGEAEANRIRTASITPVILQNKALDNQHDAIWRWDGKMPDTVVSGQGTSGLLFNIPTKGNQ